MSLVGFKAQNHPQQRINDAVDDRGTTPEAFAPLQAEFGFTIDVAAAVHNAKCDRCFDIECDGLAQSWAGERVWCNPPYSGIGRWTSKAWAEDAAEVVVMLLPANRTEQRWWQDDIEPFRDRTGSPLSVRFLPGRMRFVRPGAVIGPKGDRPPSGVCLAIWDRRARQRIVDGVLATRTIDPRILPFLAESGRLPAADAADASPAAVAL